MNGWRELLESSWVQALGWTLLHFLWEGALIGLIASILFRFTRRASAQARYLVACMLLALCGVAPVVSFTLIAAPLWISGSPPPGRLTLAVQSGSSVSGLSQLAEKAAISSRAPKNGSPDAVEHQGAADGTSWNFLRDDLQESANRVARWLVPFWLVGVVVMGLRLGTDWLRIQYWRWTSTPVVDAVLIALVDRLQKEMNFAGRIGLRVCDYIRAPSVLGWLRPCILVPTHLLTGLSPGELRAILAHELAHIARHDYLVNLFQSVVEIVLFYHPAVWWLSAKIREAREECCDEAALRMGADRVTYARALADLADLNAASSLAPSAPGGSLFRRVARLLGKAQPEPAWSRNHAAWILSLAGALFIVLGILHSSRSLADSVAAAAAPLQLTEPFPGDQANALHNAVLHADVAKVRQLLGPNRNLAGDSSLKNLVFDAVAGRNLEILQLLLDHGMNINESDASGKNALDVAVYNSGESVIRFLVEHGIDVNHADKLGVKPAWYAASLYFFSPGKLNPLDAPSSGLLEFLRQKGATFYGENKIGATIFTFMMHVVPVDAKFPGEKPATEADIQKTFAMQRLAVRDAVAGGADPNMLDSWLHETPLISALEGEHHEAALALLDLGADVNKPDNKGNAPILFSVLRVWNLPVPLDVLKELLAHGADPNSRTKGVDGMELLPAENTSLLELLLEQHGIGEVTAASDQNLNEAVQLVLAHGAHFTGNLSPAVVSLLTAAASGDLVRLKQAVVQGASVNSADADGWTPLMIALSLGHEDCVQWLLDQGADVKTKNAQGYSPLFFAAIHQQEQRVVDFLAKGADPDCGRHGTREGRPSDVGSALWLTVNNKNVPIFKSLINAGAKATSDDVAKAIQLGQVEMVRALLDKGSPPDSAVPYEHRGSVYWAVYYNQPEILKLLLDHGADPEMKTDYNETPLSQAARRSNHVMVPMLKAAIAKKHRTSASQ